MKITIRNLDYTSALDAAHPLTIERKLNQPSQCGLWLTVKAEDNLDRPKRNDSIAITGDDGAPFFIGYIAATPLPEYVGAGLSGRLYRLAILAMSDQVEQSLPSTGMTYRPINGVLGLAPISTVVHALEDAVESFNPRNLSLKPSIDRPPTNDVTLCGEREPVSYVTEYFCGDGVTSVFYLAEEPYSQTESNTKIFRELFNEPEIDERNWTNTGGTGYFALGGGGLAMRGGNGFDGQTTLRWLEPVEVCGTLLFEALGVTFANGSAGIVAGLFDGGINSASCTAGFQVTAQQGTGTVKLQPLIQGMPAGTAFTASPSNQYALRMRLHSPECYRKLAVYRGWSDSGTVSAGGEWNLSSGKLHFEIQEFVNGVGGMPVTLYDGAVANLPGECTVVAASSLNLVGSMRALHLTNLGSGWVESTPPGGGAYTRSLGSPVESGECQFQSGGKLQFQVGNIPVVGEIVAVSYRTSGRAAGRAMSSGNQQLLTNAGLPAIAPWAGTVTEPKARCSADCRNAARVTVQTASEDSSALRGTYIGTNFEFADDVWPGDALLLNAPSANLALQTIVREVQISYKASLPDLVEYRISFANDWAEDLAIDRNSNVPDDAWLPVPADPTILPNLSGLTVTALSGSTVEIDTGIEAPVGGGFEVRRRDFEFMPGTDAGLVTRSTLRNMIFSRETANDRFYIRIYDGDTPPNFSEFSTALFINLPMGS
jgi:hypothetical protein